MIKFHDPRARIGVEIESYGLSYDVRTGDGATVALLANGFPDSENFLIQIGKVMQTLVPGLKLKHWKRRRSIVRALIALGASARTAWRRIYAGKKRLWALSHDPVVDRALDKAYFRRCGLLSLATLHQAMLPKPSLPVLEQPSARIP